jgi:hypothetical protein
VGDRLGVGFRVGFSLAQGAGSQVGRIVLGTGCGAVDGGFEGGVEGGLGDRVSPGNFGASKRYLSGSSFNAAVAFRMNWRQIGPGPLAPKT